MFNLPTEFADPLLVRGHQAALLIARRIFAKHGEIRPMLLIGHGINVGTADSPLADDIDKDRIAALLRRLAELKSVDWCALLCEGYTLDAALDGRTPEDVVADMGSLAEHSKSVESVVIWLHAGILHGCATHAYRMSATGQKTIAAHGRVMQPGTGVRLEGRMVPDGGHEEGVRH